MKTGINATKLARRGLYRAIHFCLQPRYAV